MGLKKLKCQHCGSYNLHYEDGLYICEECGAKHKLEKHMEGNKADNKDDVLCCVGRDKAPAAKDNGVESGCQACTKPKFFRFSWKSCAALGVVAGLLVYFVVSYLVDFLFAKDYAVKIEPKPEQKQAVAVDNSKDTAMEQKPAVKKELELYDYDECMALLHAADRPKLLGSDTAMLEYGRRLGEDKVYFSQRDNRKSIYGVNKDSQLLEARFLKDNEGNSHIYSIHMDFTRLGKAAKVELGEAVELARGFLPCDILNASYDLLFARKKVPTAKNADGAKSYEAVYARKPSAVSGLPENISVDIQEGSEGRIVSISIHSYTYMPNLSGSEQKGPYDGDEWYSYEKWENIL